MTTYITINEYKPELDYYLFLQRAKKEHGEDVELSINKDVFDLVIKDAQIAYRKAYDDINEQLRLYIDLRPEYYPILSWWIIGTYLHRTFSTYPFLFFNAMRGSGKTRTLNVIANLSYKGNGQVQTGVTESVLFRSEKGATLLFDECEKISGHEKATLREYLNASYKKGATVKRAKKVKKKDEENYEIEAFEPFRPICMANINGMNEVLGSRCLTLVLEQSSKKYVTKLLEDFENNEIFKQIKANLLKFSVVWCSVVTGKQYIQAWNNYIKDKYRNDIYIHTYIVDVYIQLHSEKEKNDSLDLESLFFEIEKTDISGRNLELIFPLILSAYFIGGIDQAMNLLKITKEIIEEKKELEFVEDKDVSFIDFIANLSQGYSLQYTSVREITKLYKEFIAYTPEMNDNWLNEKWVGNCLKRLNLYTTKKRVSSGIEYVLAVEKAKDKIKIFKKDHDKKEE